MPIAQVVVVKEYDVEENTGRVTGAVVLEVHEAEHEQLDPEQDAVRRRTLVEMVEPLLFVTLIPTI